MAKHITLAVSLGLVILLSALFYDQRENERHHQFLLQQKATNLSSSLSSVLSARLELVHALSGFVHARPNFSDQEFMAFAAELESGRPGIRSLQLAPAGVIKHLTHPERNEAARGHDLMADAQRPAAVLRAIERRELVVIGPIELLQGGAALIGRLPIFLTEASGADSFWGFSTILLELDSLLEATGLFDGDPAFRYALRSTDLDEQDGEVFFGEAQAFGKGSCVVDVVLPSGTWKLATLCTPEWRADRPGRWGFLLLSFLLASIASRGLYLLLRQPQAAEAARSVSEARLYATAANLPGAVFSQAIDAEGTVRTTYLSQELSAAQDLEHGGDWIGECFAAPERERWEAALQAAAQNAVPCDLELQVQSGSMAGRWVHILAQPRLAQGADPMQQTEWDGLLLDVTEQRQAQDELRQAQKLETIGLLTGGVAHDFNNLLSVIQHCLDQMLDEPQAVALKFKEMLTDASAATDRSVDLVRQLLAISRRQKLQPRSCQPNELIRELVGFLGRTLGDGVSVECQLAKDLWPVFVDQSQLQSVLLNLAINARDAMNGKGRLVISTSNIQASSGAAAGVMISVKDQGRGMHPEELNQACEPFFTTKPTGKGSGLGLSVARGFIVQSGGELTLESTLGVGTSVQLHLPRMKSDVLPQLEVPQPSKSTARQDLRILLVEDDMAVRTVVRRMLLHLGHRVVEVASAESAQDTLNASAPFDVLLSDVGLAGMEGDVLGVLSLSKLRLGALCISGNLSLESGARLESAGIHFLQKPFKLEQLRSALAHFEDANPLFPEASLAVQGRA